MNIPSLMLPSIQLPACFNTGTAPLTLSVFFFPPFPGLALACLTAGESPDASQSVNATATACCGAPYLPCWKSCCAMYARLGMNLRLFCVSRDDGERFRLCRLDDMMVRDDKFDSCVGRCDAVT